MKMTQKHKVMAYILNADMQYNQTDIAKLMKVAQSTVQRAVKDIAHEQEIKDLTIQLEQAKQDLKQLGYDEKPILLPVPPNVRHTIDM